MKKVEDVFASNPPTITHCDNPITYNTVFKINGNAAASTSKVWLFWTPAPSSGSSTWTALPGPNSDQSFPCSGGNWTNGSSYLDPIQHNGSVVILVSPSNSPTDVKASEITVTNNYSPA